MILKERPEYPALDRGAPLQGADHLGSSETENDSHPLIFVGND